MNRKISVCAHFQDQIAEVLRLPAVFTSFSGRRGTDRKPCGTVRRDLSCSRPATAPQAQPQSIYRYLISTYGTRKRSFLERDAFTAREILNSLLQDLNRSFP